MLSVFDSAARNSLRDHNRRALIKAGVGGFGFMGLASLLQFEAAAGISSSNKAVINVHLDGGPPQMDMIDLKPGAPEEIRGEFQGIATKIPGFQICELMPRMAAMADKFAFIRSLVGSDGRHDAFQCQSGFPEKDLKAIGGRPAMGSVIAKLMGSPKDQAPSFVDLMQGRPQVRNSARPGFLGPTFQPFRPDISHMFERILEEGMKKELAALGERHEVSLELNADLNLGRLGGRTQLLSSLDQVRRELDGSGMMNAIDQFTQQALGILTSGRLADALDLEREDPRVLAKFSPQGNADAYQSTTSESPLSARKFLLARRLIEAGVRCVSISISDFDTHSLNFPRLKHLLPLVDHGLTALVEDLQERGMLDDVTIIAWGEFGRTPRVNLKNGGRDHWPQVGPAIMAGGGMRVGQVIGSTDRTASIATSRPVSYQDVFATLYHNLGIDALNLTIEDPRGRPQRLMEEAEIIHELI